MESHLLLLPHGRCIGLGLDDKTIQIWDAETGKLVEGPFQGHTDWIRSVAFSPEGSLGLGLVFAGPVHWTENMTETELNPTAKDQTTSCSCPQLGSVQFPVAMFLEIFKNRKRPV